MKIVIFITAAIAVFLYIGGIEVSLSPFKISLPYWHRSVSVTLMAAALMLYNLGEYASGYNKGLDKGIDITVEHIKKQQKKD